MATHCGLKQRKAEINALFADHRSHRRGNHSFKHLDRASLATGSEAHFQGNKMTAGQELLDLSANLGRS